MGHSLQSLEMFSVVCFFVKTDTNIKNIGSFQSFCPARALRALGLLLADGAPQWEGGRLFDGSTKFFYGNGCNSGMESRKIVSKVGN